MTLKNILPKRLNRYIPFCFLVLAATFLFSCGKMDDTYKDFIKNGEIIYPGRVDTLKAFSGKNQIRLTWNLVSDPKVVKNVVYWNNKADSLVKAVTKTAKVDTITVNITNLLEQTYTFQVYSYDAAGHSSVKAEVIGTVYGANYQKTLSNRSLVLAPVYSTTTKNLAITWNGVSTQAVSIDMRYVTNANDSVTISDIAVWDKNLNHLPVLPAISNLPNFKKGTAFKFKTYYKPTLTCIDTFVTGWSAPVLVP